MTLIGILIALVCEHMLSHVVRWRDHAWFRQYAQTLVTSLHMPQLWNSRWGLVPLLLPILLGVFLVQMFFNGGIYDLLGLPFSVVVLVLCLGPRDVAEEVHSYLEARARDDADTVSRIQHDLCSGPCGLNAGDGQPALVRGLMMQSHERLFGVLLWFFVAGPVGAVFYRIVSALPRVLQTFECGEGMRSAALGLHALAAWVPVRLVALLYGLAGSTDDALEAWRTVHARADENWKNRTWRLLADVGFAALQIEEGDDNHRVVQSAEEILRGALAMIQRSLLILLGIMSLFTLGGWLA
jgi:AmpE protein